MSEHKESDAAPLDGLDVGDRPGTSLTTPRALHRGPATARRPAGLGASGRAAARCRSTASSDGFGVALPTAPAGRRRPRSSREGTPVEERRRGGGAQRRHGSSAGPLGSNASHVKMSTKSKIEEAVKNGCIWFRWFMALINQTTRGSLDCQTDHTRAVSESLL